MPLNMSKVKCMLVAKHHCVRAPVTRCMRRTRRAWCQTEVTLYLRAAAVRSFVSSLSQLRILLTALWKGIFCGCASVCKSFMQPFSSPLCVPQACLASPWVMFCPVRERKACPAQSSVGQTSPKSVLRQLLPPSVEISPQRVSQKSSRTVSVQARRFPDCPPRMPPPLCQNTSPRGLFLVFRVVDLSA